MTKGHLRGRGRTTEVTQGILPIHPHNYYISIYTRTHTHKHAQDHPVTY